MTYLEQAATNLADIPAMIAAFASARGWTVAGLNITRPGGGNTYTLAAATGANGYRVMTVTDAAVPGRLARLQQPRRSGTVEAPLMLAPTKVHLFGNNAPFTVDAPYIAIVVEFGYNVYRHMYIGNMNKLGAYTGGEIISANSFAERYDGGVPNTPFNGQLVKYLFSSWHLHPTDTGQAAGGVNVVHADNPVPWRVFQGPYGFNTLISLQGTEVFGGWSDAINSLLGIRALASYAASNILTPINLYCSRAADGANYRFRPLGHVPGVRMVRMDGIDPGEQIGIAATNWKVFPEFSRDLRQTATRDQSGVNGFYWAFETSYLLGLAYRMD